MSEAGSHRTIPVTTVALVTGATGGIGYQTAKGLATRGATVLITGRDERRGAQAASSITTAAGHQRVAFLQADHAIVGVNRELGGAVVSQLKQMGLPEQIDLLINNVGGIWARRTLTADGYEATLAVNFLAPYVVTETMRPLLSASQSPRVINVTSSLGWLIRQVHGDLLGNLDASQGQYVGIEAHARAKLLNVAWTLHLARKTTGSLTVAAVNPGMAWTSMTQALTPEVVPSWRYWYPMVRFFQKRGDAGKAAQVCVHLAAGASPADVHGRYLTEHGKPGKVPAALLDQAFQEKVVKTAQSMAQQAPTASV